MPELREHLLAEGLSPRTVGHYLGAVRRAEAWFDLHDGSLARATATDVAAYLATTPRTWASRNLVRAALVHFWRSEGRENPPVRALRVPPKPRMVCRALDEDDARILAKAARNDGGRRGLALSLALYMGLRREEVATLRWSCFDAGWLTVVGKGDRTRRLPVHHVVVELLAEHEPSGPFLFPGRFEPHVHANTIWQWVRDLSDAAGLGKGAHARLPPHEPRHGERPDGRPSEHAGVGGPCEPCPDQRLHQGDDGAAARGGRGYRVRLRMRTILTTESLLCRVLGYAHALEASDQDAAASIGRTLARPEPQPEV